MALIDPGDLEQATLRALASFAGRRVVEIGTGDGRLAWTLAAGSAFWLALDTDLDELSLAAQDDEAAQPGPVRLAVGDGRALALPPASCDVAFFAWSLC
jgi:ubiquinone/menaquinone biosynthesis C-methylase UbiE